MLCDSSIFNILSTLSVARLRDRCTNPSKTALYFEKHYILASLVKGEVLSPKRIRATTGGIDFLPHPFRFSDTSVNNPSIVGSASHCNRSSPLHKGAKGDSALPTIPKPHYPSPCTTTLASLVKGEVLSPERIRATTGGIATSLLPKPHYPSPRTKLASPRKRVRFCCSVKPSQLWWGLNLIELLSLKLQSIRSATIRPAPTFPKPHYPSPRTIALASLVKGRWLDGTTQTVALLRPACDMSALFILQTFCRQDGGIAIPPFAQHHIYASLVKGEVLSPKRIRATTGGIAFLPHPFRFSDTSVNNPSVTVTENTILCQRIFNFYKKQY